MIDANEFDALCQDFVAKQLVADEAETVAKAAKALVLDAVQKHGSVPKNAEASRRVEGADWCGTVTSGTSVEVNDSTVQELEITLSRAKRAEVFPLLFARRVEFNLVKGAETVLKQAKLPARWRDRIHQLYAQSFVVKGKTPSLKVEPIAAVREREEKAAKKAAKTKAKQSPETLGE